MTTEFVALVTAFGLKRYRSSILSSKIQAITEQTFVYIYKE